MLPFAEEELLSPLEAPHVVLFGGASRVLMEVFLGDDQ